MTKKQDQDILALKKARNALMLSTSKKMLIANLNYLYDYFIVNPPKHVAELFEQKDKDKMEVKYV